MDGLHPFNYGNALQQATNIQGGQINNALNQRKLNQFNNPQSPQIEFGKVNPRDFTSESMEIFKKSQNFNDLSRYERYRTGKINGALHLIDVTGQDSPIPLSTTQSESQANRQLSAGTERGKADVQLATKPNIEAEVAKAKITGKREGELEILKPKRIVSTEAEKAKTTRLKTLIAKAKNQASGWTTGFLGSKLKDTAGTPAFDLSQTLSTLQANAGFDRLQEMRDASITGGALGQVSERELALLVDSYSAIGQSQSKKQFIENLNAFEKQLDETWARVGMAYELDYGEKYAGQTIEPSQSEGPRTVTTQEEFDALPSGTTFIEDGQEYRKP